MRKLLLVVGVSLSQLGAGQVRADAVWGNQFQTGTPPMPAVVTKLSDQWSRFTVYDQMVVTAAQVMLKDIASQGIVVGLQEDNGHGFPKGKYIVSEMVSAAKDGWNRVRLPETTLKKNTVYYLVVTVKDTGAVGWLGINVANRGTQPSGEADPQWTHGGGVALDKRTSSIFVLETKGPNNFGQPYVTKYNSAVLGGKNIPAQRFVFQPPPTGESKVGGVTLALNVGLDDGTTEYTVALLDETNTIIEEAKIPPGKLVNGSSKPEFVPFSGNTQLKPGQAYSLAVYSEAKSGSVAWASAMTDADEAAQKATWQGQTGYAFTYSDPSLKTPGQPDLKRDLVFAFTMQ